MLVLVDSGVSCDGHLCLIFKAHGAKWKEMRPEQYLRLYNELNNMHFIIGRYL